MAGPKAKTYDIGDGRELTMVQIAAEAGVSVAAVHGRIAKGLTGVELLIGAPPKEVVKPTGATAKLGIMRPTPEGGWSDRELFNLRAGLSPVGASYGFKPPHPQFEDDGRKLPTDLNWGAATGNAASNDGLPNNFNPNVDWRKLLDENEASTTSLTQSVKKAFEPAPDQLVWPDEDD